MKYELTRQKLIEYYPTIISQLILLPDIQEELIKGGEFIIDVYDIIKEIEWVEGSLVGQPGKIHYTEIQLTYAQDGTE